MLVGGVGQHGYRRKVVVVAVVVLRRLQNNLVDVLQKISEHRQAPHANLHREGPYPSERPQCDGAKGQKESPAHLHKERFAGVLDP